MDTKEPLDIRALREQAPAVLEIFTNFIIVRCCTENWIRYWLKLKLNSPGRIKPQKPGLWRDFSLFVANFS